jgi:thymidine kinase
VHHFQGSSLEVITGPMFSGKTEELIRRIRRAQIARQKVQIFKPATDNRYHEEDVVSHNSQQIKAVALDRPVQIFQKLLDSTRVVAIDEVQFFDNDILKIVSKLARRGYRVICAGLDQDYRGVPFGPIPTLMAQADDVVKLQAICSVCGNPASKTQRLVPNQEKVLVGEADVYQARCRMHHEFKEEEATLLPMQEELNLDINTVQ